MKDMGMEKIIFGRNWVVTGKNGVDEIDDDVLMSLEEAIWYFEVENIMYIQNQIDVSLVEKEDKFTLDE